jgi:hypothetical protein
MFLMANDSFPMMSALFGAMVFIIWILPGMVNRTGRHPEDRPARN